MDLRQRHIHFLFADAQFLHEPAFVVSHAVLAGARVFFLIHTGSTMLVGYRLTNEKIISLMANVFEQTPQWRITLFVPGHAFGFEPAFRIV